MGQNSSPERPSYRLMGDTLSRTKNCRWQARSMNRRVHACSFVCASRLQASRKRPHFRCVRAQIPFSMPRNSMWFVGYDRGRIPAEVEQCVPNCATLKHSCGVVVRERSTHQGPFWHLLMQAVPDRTLCWISLGTTSCVVPALHN